MTYKVTWEGRKWGKMQIDQYLSTIRIRSQKKIPLKFQEAIFNKARISYCKMAYSPFSNGKILESWNYMKSSLEFCLAIAQKNPHHGPEAVNQYCLTPGIFKQLKLMFNVHHTKCIDMEVFSNSHPTSLTAFQTAELEWSERFKTLLTHRGCRTWKNKVLWSELIDATKI